MNAALENPILWVAVSFVIFCLLSGKKLWQIITAALDSRSQKIKAELEEAVRLREEAQTLLNAYQQRQQEVLAEAERILTQTKADAKAIAEKAEADLQQSLEKRKAMAMQRIAQSETKAIQAVQQHVVDIAISAAKMVVTDQLKAGYGQELIKLAASDVEKKLH